MKIETAILEEFLNKARMGEIETCLLEFGENGLYISAMSPANSHKSDSLLKKEAFAEYEPIGNVGVDDLSRLIKVFKRLGKELDFKIEGNLLVATGAKKTLKFELVDEKFIEKKKDMPDMKHTTTFTIPAKSVSEFLKDAQMNKDVAIYFETVDGGVKVMNDGKYKFTHNFDSEGTKGGEKIKFGAPLLSALNGIDTGDLVFRVKTDYPLLVDHKTDKYEITFLVAPRVDPK